MKSKKKNTVKLEFRPSSLPMLHKCLHSHKDPNGIFHDKDNVFASVGRVLHERFSLYVKTGTRDCNKLDKSAIAILNKSIDVWEDFVKEKKPLTIRSEFFMENNITDGTADLVVETEDELWIIDLKTGQMPVKLENNEQLLTYLWLAYEVMPKKKLRVAVIQVTVSEDLIYDEVELDHLNQYIHATKKLKLAYDDPSIATEPKPRNNRFCRLGCPNVGCAFNSNSNRASYVEQTIEEHLAFLWHNSSAKEKDLLLKKAVFSAKQHKESANKLQGIKNFIKLVSKDSVWLDAMPKYGVRVRMTSKFRWTDSAPIDLKEKHGGRTSAFKIPPSGEVRQNLIDQGFIEKVSISSLLL